MVKACERSEILLPEAKVPYIKTHVPSRFQNKKMKLLATFLSCAIVSIEQTLVKNKTNLKRSSSKKKNQEILFKIFRLVTGLARSGVLKIKLLATVEARHF